MSAYTSLDGDSIRDFVDVRDRYTLLLKAELEARHSYGGSMKFESRGVADYPNRRPYPFRKKDRTTSLASVNCGAALALGTGHIGVNVAENPGGY